mmetsp:Transcript_25872/g.83292  ORF Transcript_25872/g.83292 Transcript_25872/m.83292 type:complete len:226 (-) Transcript_25872:213-890(-)
MLAAVSSHAVAATATAGAWTAEQSIYRTRAWIDTAVVRLGLCPYAAKPFHGDRIRYAVSECTSDEALVASFFEEGLLLLDSPEEELATTMLIAPKYEGGIGEFYSLYEWLTDLLESEEEEVLANGVQPAFFHPAWSFDGLPADSPIHFEKRAPCPVINLLRRSTLDRTVEEGLRRGVIVNQQISEHNAAALQAEGTPALSRLFDDLGALQLHTAADEGGADSGPR